jgi:hypothetical protein
VPLYGNAEIKAIGDHFAKPLKLVQYDQSTAIYEWADLKKTVQSRYMHKSSMSLWKTLMQDKELSKQYQNLLAIITLILTISFSSATVERGFSVVTR